MGVRAGRGVKRIVLLGAGFAYMVLLIEAIRVVVAWWQGELAQPDWGDMVLIALLLPLVWIWWRYISPFGRTDCVKCLPPSEADPRP